MVLSYSAVAQPTSDTPSVISIHSLPSPTASTSTLPPPSPSLTATTSTSTTPSQTLHLILDAGPLLSLTPLRHLAQCFHTTPMVLAELRDPKAREHWDRLALSGIDVKVEHPRAESMAKVIEFAKKTGDFAVLSKTDLSVVALTYQYEVEVNGDVNIRTELGQRRNPLGLDQESHGEPSNMEKLVQEPEDEGRDREEEVENQDEDQEEQDEETETLQLNEVSQSIEQVLLGNNETSSEPSGVVSPSETFVPTSSIPEDESQNHPPSDDDDGEGDWITPTNVSTHRSHDLGLVPDDASSSKNVDTTPLAAACMTGDFAVQNVLLGMGLGLVGEGGKRISKVRSWVLRCHACFKICKDSSKKFCPSCGNPSLMRTTVTTSSKTGQQKIHLKKNFQYHLRGTKYTIPDAKPGRAKGQQKGGSGLVLREDQGEWMDAVKLERGRVAKEERKAAKGDGLKGWDDPDWLPEIITVGMSGKGRSGGHGLPTIGHGRKNPNQAKRKK